MNYRVHNFGESVIFELANLRSYERFMRSEDFPGPSKTGAPPFAAQEKKEPKEESGEG